MVYSSKCRRLVVMKDVLMDARVLDLAFGPLRRKSSVAAFLLGDMRSEDGRLMLS